jgi:hypothetical protein
LINVCIGPSSNHGPSGSTGRFRKKSHLGLLTLFLRITQILIITEISGGSCLIRRNRRIAVTKAILTELRGILKYVTHVRIVSTANTIKCKESIYPLICKQNIRPYLSPFWLTPRKKEQHRTHVWWQAASFPASFLLDFIVYLD